jgi:hypothetical protein
MRAMSEIATSKSLRASPSVSASRVPFLNRNSPDLPEKSARPMNVKVWFPDLSSRASIALRSTMSLPRSKSMMVSSFSPSFDSLGPDKAKYVIATATGKRVCARSTAQVVIAMAALELVRAGASDKLVLAAATLECVVAVSSDDGHKHSKPISYAAVQCIVAAVDGGRELSVGRASVLIKSTQLKFFSYTFNMPPNAGTAPS